MPRLLMIGGNRSTIGSIEAMRAAGFEVAVAEKLPRQYALAHADHPFEISPSDIAGLRTAVSSLGGVDGIIGINEAAMTSAAILQREFGLPGLAPGVIRRTTSKLAQRRAWAADPDLQVPFQVIDSPESLRRAVHILGLPVIVKPDLSHGGARGVSLVRAERQLEDAFEFAAAHLLPGSQIVVEQALSGPQFSAELMTRSSQTRVLAIGRKIKSKAPYCVDLAIAYPGITDAATLSAVTRMCAKAKALLGIDQGPGHIEFALTQEGPRPIELGARCGGSITPDIAAHVSGYHPMVEAAKLACDAATDGWETVAQNGGILLFLAFAPCLTRALHIPDRVKQDRAVIDLDARLPDNGVIAPLQWTSQRIGYMGVTADDGNAAFLHAMRLADQIRLETSKGEMLRPLSLEAGVAA